MPKDDRNIFERLDDIERKIPSFEYEKPTPISKIIGRPFEEYLNDATIYGYEADERKFNNTIKKQKIRLFVFLSILVPIFIFDVVSLVICQQFEWLLLVSTFLTLSCFVIALITLIKYKNKQPMKSFWNIKNTNFYLIEEGDHKRLVAEKNHGAIFYIMIIFKVLSIAGNFACALCYMMTSMETTTNSTLFWVGLILSYVTFLVNIIVIRIDEPYYFSNFIIEAEDSYVTYPKIKYFKK